MIFTAQDDFNDQKRRCWWAYRIARLTEREPDFKPVTREVDATFWQMDQLNDWFLCFHWQEDGTWIIDLRHRDNRALEQMVLPLLLYRFRSRKLRLKTDESESSNPSVPQA